MDGILFNLLSYLDQHVGSEDFQELLRLLAEEIELRRGTVKVLAVLRERLASEGE